MRARRRALQGLGFFYRTKFREIRVIGRAGAPLSLRGGCPAASCGIQSIGLPRSIRSLTPGPRPRREMRAARRAASSRRRFHPACEAPHNRRPRPGFPELPATLAESSPQEERKSRGVMRPHSRSLRRTALLRESSRIRGTAPSPATGFPWTERGTMRSMTTSLRNCVSFKELGQRFRILIHKAGDSNCLPDAPKAARLIEWLAGIRAVPR